MSSAEPVAWVLNLDAEDELAHAGAHTPTATATARIEALLPRLTGPGELVHEGDGVVWPGSAPGDLPATGRAWCPTRWALEQLARAGVRPPAAPSQQVLRRVSHRRFSHELGPALPGAGHAETGAQLRQLLSATATLEGVSEQRQWLLKRPFSYAGRGRRRVLATGPTAEDQAWIDASLRAGTGLQVEPLVARTLDCALHGWLAEDGGCVLGAATVQRIDATGAWVSSELAGRALEPPEHERLLAEAQRTATALHQAGYFGPFGLDAFRWRAPDGATHFHPRCEVNARYSMGWATGMSEAHLPRRSA
jgi:hypothetical protein